MKIAPLPKEEKERLEKLEEYQILDTLPEQNFDDLTQIASCICQTPIALISLVDQSRQWFKSNIGINAKETPRDMAFCSHAILQDEVFIVSDSFKDERFYDNPLAASAPHVRFYAGAPLITPSGHRIGTLCVIDHTPRELSSTQLLSLQALARQVVAHLELRRQVFSNFLSKELIENSPAAMYCKDYQTGKGIFVEWNKACENLWGLKKKDVLGKSDSDFFPKDQANFFKEKDLETLKFQKTIFIKEEPIDTPSGHFKLSTWKVPVNDHDGKPRYLLGISLNITTQVELEKQILSAKVEAEAASRAKSAFLANMSHEIRTPMNAIIGMSELLAETDLNKDQKRYVEIFRRAGDYLFSLINDILDVSKIEFGNVKIETIDFNLRETIEETLEIMAPRAYEKNLDLILDYSNILKNIYVGDPYRLKQIVLNLVSNAIKFTSQGEVKIEINENKDRSNGNIIISISDTGIGIPNDKIDDLFEIFAQVDTSTTRKFGGTGLGLSICKQLTNLMKGKIWAISHEGKGSTFHFTLDIPESINQSSSIEKNKFHNFSGAKLLLIDEHLTTRFIIKEMLKPWDIDVFESNNGEEGLDLALKFASKNESFQMILINNIGSIEFTQKIRKYQNYINTPIIIFTSNHWHYNHSLAKNAGATDFLHKPIRKKELFNMLSAHLGDNGKSNDIFNDKNPRRGNSHDLFELNILLVDDSEDNRTLIKSYLKNTNHKISEAENGQLAYDKIKSTTFDIIFMDIQMPILDGHQATKLIRIWEKEKNVEPHLIIALTAYALEEEKKKSMDVGCDQHLTKPIKKQTLLNVLNEIIEKKLKNK